MSRAFTKEDAQHEDVMVVARAPLPDGVENLVTPRGLDQLREEEADLRGVLDQARAAGDKERLVAELEGALDELLYRLGKAVVVDAVDNDKAVVRFGDTVTVEPLGGGAPFDVTIVGVDVSDPDEGLVSFLAPIAQRVSGLAAGQATEGGAPSVRVVAIR